MVARLKKAEHPAGTHYSAHVSKLVDPEPVQNNQKVTCSSYLRHRILFRPSNHSMRMRAAVRKKKHDVGSHKHNSTCCRLDGVNRDPRQNTVQQAQDKCQ